jgi:acetylglutamate kinase
MDKTHTVSMRPEHVEMDRNLYIIKIGGNVIDNSDNLYHFLKDFTDLPGDKILVHGGGKVATQLCETLGIEAKLVEGRRITDIETLRVVTMVYGGLINKNIVAQLQYFGNNAIGLTGADGDFIRASKRPVKTIDYGYVGDINEHSIDPDRINRLLSAGFTPVFCALTHDGEGQLLNTNADTIASALAIALSSLYSTTLIYCFEKRGVLTDINDEDSLIEKINPDDYNELKNNKIIHSGMLPKLDNAFSAIDSGVAKVIIGKSDDLGKIKQNQSFGTLLSKSI